MFSTSDNEPEATMPDWSVKKSENANKPAKTALRQPAKRTDNL
jgi:hypothetical protein